MITIIATMGGCQGYRAIGDFTQRYNKKIITYLELEKDRLPAYATVRRVLIGIDHKKFEDIFTKVDEILYEKKQLSMDNSRWQSHQGHQQKEEDKKLAHLVSFFASDSKEILTARKTASISSRNDGRISTSSYYNYIRCTSLPE